MQIVYVIAKMADQTELDCTTESHGNKANEERENVFDMSKCTTETVVVYLDRAEVCRSLKVSVHAGENEIVLNNLSNFLDKDSIRVEGKGPATISEVSFQTRHLTPDEEAEQTDRTSDLRKKLEEVRGKEHVLNNKLQRLRKQRGVLDSFADNVSKPGFGTPERHVDKGPNMPIALNKETLEGMSMFLDLYADKATDLDDTIYATDKELKAIRDEIRAIEKNLHEMRAKLGAKEARELSILLDAKEDAEVSLTISYVVTRAKWTPKYDIRVFSDDKQMKILYFGMIEQATGEDWENVKMSLSTAMPSVGGTIPELGTQKLSFKPKITASPVRARMMSKVRGPPPPPQMMAMCMAAPPVPLMEFDGMNEAAEMQIETAEVKDSITSAIFEIARRTNIPADNVGHKVSIAIIDLQPEFEYECVPKKSTFAFLKAKVKNTSQYALLAGPTNIFLDNNFISKAELKAVSPGEDLNCSLGIDPGVKVTYKPIHKYREQSGYFSKSQNTTYKQMIEVKNNHKEAIKVLLSDQLPLTTEKEIKVTLIEPVIKRDHQQEKHVQPVRINKANNIEWDLHIEPGKVKDIILRYTVEHPAQEELDTTEVAAPTDV